MSQHRKHSENIPFREREQYTSKEGLEFHIYANRWQLNVNNSLNVGWLSDYLPPNQEEALRRVLASRASRLAVATLQASSGRFKRFLSIYINADEGISIDAVLDFFSSDEPKSIKSDVKVILECCLTDGYEKAFEPGMGDYLTQLVIGERGNRFNHEKSEETRALTEYERKQFMYQLVRAHYTGQICEKTYLTIKLIYITGKRVEQLASTKLCDFRTEIMQIGGSPRKVTLYQCPVAKQKAQTFRSEFNEIPLSWDLEFEKDIAAVAKISITSAESILGCLTPEQKQHIPLFCINSLSALALSEIDRLGTDKVLSGKILHAYRGISTAINAAFANQNIFSVSSERTGKILKINARRLRHTHATKLAISGASIAEVANSLDHAGYKAAMAYVNALPVLAVKIGEQLEKTLSALAKRFDKNQVISVDTEKVIKLYTKHGAHDVGICGKEAFCTDDFPIACYECELFVPNPFGNHQAVLSYVENKINEACEFGDFRGVENWRTIQIAVLERKFMADQVRIKMLNEIPAVHGLPYDGGDPE
ncbi:hypothetical protein ACET57_05265 [Aeromonas veronii]|uniref:hypothetical protein n=1 Tax=Aeromonas TaxID=642 RepID=UPI0038D33823